ncbi:MAG: tripartite tricarboxylate transporter TctB family protein [Alphaproteobacteria bacterium]
MPAPALGRGVLVRRARPPAGVDVTARSRPSSQDSEGTLGGAASVAVEATNETAEGGISLETITVRGDIVAGALCLAAAAVGYFVLVPKWVYVPATVAGTLDSPAFLPRALFMLLALFGALLLLQSLAHAKAIAGEGKVPRGDWMRAAGMLFIYMFYLGAVFMVGLPLASGLSLALAMVYFGERRPLVIGIAIVLLPTLLWLFFVKIALVPMPMPIIELAAGGPLSRGGT